MNKAMFLTSTMGILLVSSGAFAAATIINGETNVQSTATYEGLDINENGDLKLSLPSGSTTPFTVNVTNDIAVAGGKVNVGKSTTLAQTTPNSTQGLLIRDNGSVTVASQGTITLNSKLDLNSGGSLTLGAGSSSTSGGITTTIPGGIVTTTNDIILNNGSSVSIGAGAQLTGGTTLTADDSKISLSSSKNSPQARLTTTGDMTLTNSTVTMTENSVIQNTTGDITLTNTSVSGGSSSGMGIITSSNDLIVNNMGQTTSSGTTSEGAKITYANLNAGHDLQFTGSAENSRLSASNNATINGDVTGVISAGQTIDYQTGTAVLSGISSTETNIAQPSNVTLNWGTGSGDIVADGHLTLNNFKHTGDITSNNTLNMTWNNEIDGDLVLNNAAFNMTKSDTQDGWLKLNNMSVNNSAVNIDSAYIQAQNGTITFGDNSSLTLRISGPQDTNGYNYGHLIADTINISTNGTKLNLVLDNNALQKGVEQDFQLLEASTINGSFATLSKNNRYIFTDKGNGLFGVTQTATAGDIVDNEGGNGEIRDMASAWLDGPGFISGTAAAQMADHLNTLSQTPGSQKEFIDALETLAPTASPYVTALAADTTRQIYNVIGTRFDRDSYRGTSKRRAVMPQNSLWAQGLASKANFDGKYNFDTKTKGGAIGIDTDPCPGCRIGIGYAYTQSDIDSLNRKTDVDSHTGILYADFQGDPVYLNIIGSYTWSAYNEKKDVIGFPVKADYDVDVIGAQVMLGYDMGSWKVSKNYRTGSLMPEIGARYMFIKQHAYTDSAEQHVGAADGSTITGVAGAHYTADYKMGSIVFYPDFKAAVTYDFKQDELHSIVRLPNGLGYRLTSDRLDKLGVEAGIELGLRIANRVDIALSYLGMFRKDYKNHTGLLNLKYRF